MVKSSCKYGHDFTHYLLEDTSKARHIRVQPMPGGKIEDIQQKLKDLLHEDLETVIIHAGTNNATTDTPQMIVDNDHVKTKYRRITTKILSYQKQINHTNR